MMKDYLIILEEGPDSWGAYSPDVPGCAAVANSKEAVLREFLEALQSHLELLAETGEEAPQPTSFAIRLNEIAS